MVSLLIDVRKSTRKVDERNPRACANTPYCNDMDSASAEKIVKQVKKMQEHRERGYILLKSSVACCLMKDGNKSYGV